MRIFVVLFTLLLPYLLTAQEKISLVKDILPGYSKTKGIEIKESLYDSLSMFFISGEGDIYRSDGTEKGTFRIKNIKSESQVIKNGELYFIGKDNYSQENIWKTNKDTVIRITDFTTNVNLERILPPVNDHVLFCKSNWNGYMNELYSISPGNKVDTLFTEYPIYSVVKLNNKLLFIPDKYPSPEELWVTDGTLAGTKRIIQSDTTSLQFKEITFYNNEYYFIYYGDFGSITQQLWKSDLTEEGTTLVMDLYDHHGIYDVENLIAFNTGLYFFGRTDTLRTVNTSSLFRYDENSRKLETISSYDNWYWRWNRYNGESPIFKNKLYFSASDNNGFGEELWSFDGTNSGIGLVKDINPRGESSNPYSFTQANNKLYFKANYKLLNNSIFETDGTSEGTKLLAAPQLGDNSFSCKLVNFRSEIYYPTFRDGFTSIYKINKNTGLEEKVADLEKRIPLSSSPTFFPNIGRKRYFYADLGLWVTEGSSENTYLIKTINLSNISHPVVIEGIIYFTGYSNSRGMELWRSDGTYEGTYQIKQLPSEKNRYKYVPVIAYKNKLFLANSGTGPLEIWTSGGDYQSTKLFQRYPLNNEINSFLSSSEGLFYNTYRHNTSDVQPMNFDSYNTWSKSDGTIENTYPIFNFNHDSLYFSPQLINNKIYFIERSKSYYSGKQSYSKIWTFKNNSKHPESLLNLNDLNIRELLANINNEILFTCEYPNSRLFKFNSSGDTTLLSEKIIFQYGIGIIDNKFIFTGYSEEDKSYNIYTSDGTRKGTIALGTLPSRNSVYSVSDTIACDNYLYFFVNNNITQELWKTDGTKEGTKQVVTFPENSSGYNLKVNENRIYFIGDFPETGSELYTFLCEEDKPDLNISEFTLYPNPTTSILNVKLSGHLKSPQTKIFNIFGKEAWNGMLENDNSLNVEKLSAGIYILELDIEDERNRFTFIKL